MRPLALALGIAAVLVASGSAQAVALGGGVLYTRNSRASSASGSSAARAATAAS